MSGYGGYENEGGFGDGGFGGSQNTPSRGGPSDGKPRRNYDEQTLIPVTIKMLNESLSAPGGGAADLQLKDGRSLHMVKLVGAVRNHDNRSTNIIIDLEDGTGLVQVKVWLNEAEDCSGVLQLRDAACKDHTYIRVIGQMKEFDGQRQLVANDVRPVKSGNEVTYHFLEVAYSYERHLKRDRNRGGMGTVGGGMGYGIGNIASNPPQPMHGGIGVVTPQGGSLGGGSALNDAILMYIQSAGAENEHGVHKSDIIGAAASKGYSPKDVQNAISHLSNEGQIYSTIDDDHYQFAS